MAALRPCPSAASTSTSTTRLLTSPSLGLCMLPISSLGRRGPKPRLRHVFRCQKADHPCEPDSNLIKKLIQHLDEFGEKFTAELLACPNLKYADAGAVSKGICTITGQALNLASDVMNSAVLRLGIPSEISLHTIEMTVRMHTSIFLKIAKDTYHNKSKRTDIISFLDALGGLAAISHILSQDALAAINHILIEDDSLKYSPDIDVDARRRKFKQEMNSLIHKFRMASPLTARNMLSQTLNDAMMCAYSFVRKMTCLREWTIAQVPGKFIYFLEML